uniref:glutathione S-transferase TCHQD n=1 Tax=Erigeron canadensis TaxID=72917 RepID=UPI001CB94429|nr:glutathione S-transferase TCHQD [Erigeron canadensis]XP_043621460.1 glutathione S-transferase TCHQD [Erigeron canadensis]XP_043621461.1 glutathione S-transferase TCHQD [Erigeron canadensis]
MQLYHHPYSLDSQKVRLALEERNIDYTSYHVNPVTGKNMDPSFFRMNPSAKVPVFQNGSHVIFDTIEIIQYIERIALVSSGSGIIKQSSKRVVEWMYKIQEWNPKFFTLSHIPEKYHIYVSKFIRRVIIARMSEAPDLAAAYHTKLKEAYETEEKLHNPQVLQRSEQHLIKLLDEVEMQLEETLYLASDEFTLADVMLVPILARLTLLGLEKTYISDRPKLAEYWMLVQTRPSYKIVIGKYYHGWRRRKTLLKTWCIIRMRCMFKRY